MESTNEASSSKTLWAVVTVVVVALIGTSAYSLMGLKNERLRAEDMAAANVNLRDSLAQVQTQLQTVSAKLETLSQEKAVRRVPVAAANPRSAARTVSAANDPRWKQVQERLADQQKQIEGTQKDLAGTRDDLASTRDDVNQTRQDLSGRLDSTRDELNGSIAKNHDELVALQKRGQRNYFEFQLGKSKQFQKIGPLSVSLRSVNFKHKNYDMNVLVDDQQLEKKHVSVYEPVMIRPVGQSQPLELVVNEVSKNQVKGYVSSPKYSESELASAPPPAVKQ